MEVTVRYLSWVWGCPALSKLLWYRHMPVGVYGSVWKLGGKLRTRLSKKGRGGFSEESKSTPNLRISLKPSGILPAFPGITSDTASQKWNCSYGQKHELNKTFPAETWNLRGTARTINQAQPVSGDLWPLQMSTTMGIKMPQHSQHQPSGNDSKWSTHKKNWKLDHKKSEFLMFLDVFKHRDFEPGHGAMIHHDHWNWGNCFSISRWNPQCSASSVVCNTTSECNGVISCFCTL